MTLFWLQMLSSYQLTIADLYNIPIDTVKKLLPNFFEKEKYVLHLQPANIGSQDIPLLQSPQDVPKDPI